MLEIFALPYIFVSGVIGWAIFEPFVRVEKSESLSLAKVAITDLLAIAVPVSVLFLSARWMMPENILSFWVQSIVIMSALLFAATALAAGLFLVPKAFQVTFLKRMIVVGIIAPFGILLTVGWIGLLVWACIYSIVYFAPTSIAIAAATFGLRVLALWVCQMDSQVDLKAIKAEAIRTIETSSLLK
ncbi:MAG: hypothetical protein AAF539_01400 [Planctomycetota bacterium]